MAIRTKPTYVPNGLSTDRVVVGMFQELVDRLETPRIAAVNFYTDTISNPPTQQQVADVATQNNLIIAALISSGLMEEHE